MRTYKLKPFSRFARQNKIEDAQLCDAVRRAENGLVDADLGGGVIKQRLARKGQGKSKGFRSILLFQHGQLCFFAYGFPKSDNANLNRKELEIYRKLADTMLNIEDPDLAKAITEGKVQEVVCNE